MGTRPAWWVPRENSFFRETLGESGRAGTQNMCFWASGSASLPETGAKRRGCDPMGVVEGTMWVPLQGRWVSWENSFFRETVGTSVGGGVL